MFSIFPEGFFFQSLKGYHQPTPCFRTVSSTSFKITQMCPLCFTNACYPASQCLSSWYALLSDNICATARWIHHMGILQFKGSRHVEVIKLKMWFFLSLDWLTDKVCCVTSAIHSIWISIEMFERDRVFNPVWICASSWFYFLRIHLPRNSNRFWKVTAKTAKVSNLAFWWILEGP